MDILFILNFRVGVSFFRFTEIIAFNAQSTFIVCF